jgi:hypothetical protein
MAGLTFSANAAGDHCSATALATSAMIPKDFLMGFLS